MRFIWACYVFLLSAMVTAHELAASDGATFGHYRIGKNKPMAGRQSIFGARREPPTVSSLVEVQEEMHWFQGLLPAKAQDVVKNVLKEYRRWCNVNTFEQGHSWMPLPKNFFFVRKLDPDIWVFLYNFKSRISQLQIQSAANGVEQPNIETLTTFCRFKPHPDRQMLVYKNQPLLPNDIIERINVIRAKSCNWLPPVGSFTAKLLHAYSQLENIKLEILFEIHATQFVVELHRDKKRSVYVLYDIYEFPAFRNREETKRIERLASYPCRIPPLKQSLVNHEELMQNLIGRRRMCYFAVPDIKSYRLEQVEYIDSQTRVLVMRINGEMLQLTTKVKGRSLSGDTEDFSQQSVLLQSIRYRSVAADGKVEWILTDECVLHPEDKAWVSMCSREYHPVPCRQFRSYCRFDEASHMWLDENRCLVAPAEILAKLGESKEAKALPKTKYSPEMKSGIAVREKLDSIWEAVKYWFVLEGFSPIRAEIRADVILFGLLVRGLQFQLFLKSTVSGRADLMVEFKEPKNLPSKVYDPKFKFLEVFPSTGSAALREVQILKHEIPKPDDVEDEEIFKIVNYLNVLRRRKCLLAPLKDLVVVSKAFTDKGKHDGYVFATHDDVFSVNAGGVVTELLRRPEDAKTARVSSICDIQSDNFARDEAQWVLTTVLQSKAVALISLMKEQNANNGPIPYTIFFYHTEDRIERLNFLLDDSQTAINEVVRQELSASIQGKLNRPHPSKPHQLSFFRLWGEHFDEARMLESRSGVLFHRVPANYYLMDLMQKPENAKFTPVQPREMVCKVYAMIKQQMDEIIAELGLKSAGKNSEKQYDESVKPKSAVARPILMEKGKWATVFHILNTLASQRWAIFHRLPNRFFRVISYKAEKTELDIEDYIAESNDYIYRVEVEGTANGHQVKGQFGTFDSAENFAKQRLEYSFTAPTWINTEPAERLERLKRMASLVLKETSLCVA